MKEIQDVNIDLVLDNTHRKVPARRDTSDIRLLLLMPVFLHGSCFVMNNLNFRMVAQL